MKRWLPQDATDWLLIAVAVLSGVCLLSAWAFALSFVGAALHA